MHGRRRIIAPIVLLVVVVGAVAIWYVNQPTAAQDGALTASGTIEATSVVVSPEVAGRVTEVTVAEGDQVAAGDVVVRLDSSLLDAQRGQAEAAIAQATAMRSQADAAVAAAQASLDLLRAGPSDEQLAVARRQVQQAQTAYRAARKAYADLSGTEKGLPTGVTLKIQRDNAKAAVSTAQAQYDLVAAGARPEQSAAAEAQVEAAQAQQAAAQAQLESADAALAVLDAQAARLTLLAPTAGRVLSRAIEPGETVVPGAALLVLGDLDRLTLTVYVPEDRYGEVVVGEPVSITVDSFPGERFGGTVSRIADQAEFTPRNVQTVEGRTTTVYAIELALDPSAQKLKPGMPADVVFGS
jgi:HlyD family secretion protein